MVTGTAKGKVNAKKPDKPALTFELDGELNAMIAAEHDLIPSKSKGMIIRQRLHQSYQDYPLPAFAGKERSDDRDEL